VTESKIAATEKDVRQWAITAARAADDKKAVGTVVLEVKDLLGITDAIVITSGSNDRQVRTIAEEVERRIKDIGGPAPRRIEGLSEAAWILMDYGDIVVHVFQQETREFYNLERLWADAPHVDWSETVSASAAEH
jgi:ribosome-associated protein